MVRSSRAKSSALVNGKNVAKSPKIARPNFHLMQGLQVLPETLAEHSEEMLRLTHSVAGLAKLQAAGYCQLREQGENSGRTFRHRLLWHRLSTGGVKA